MKLSCAALIPLLFLLGCSGARSVGTPSSNSELLTAGTWTIRYSPGMPSHPYPSNVGQWYFDFPTDPNSSVNYVTASYGPSTAPSQMVSVTFTISTTGNPVFNYQLGDPQNTCNYPAHVRLFLERSDDDMSSEFYRWWSNPVSYELAATRDGAVTLSAPLSPHDWSSVLGRFGDEDQDTINGFNSALAHLGNVGMTYGGGCFAGHGVNVSGGTARFTLLNYSVK